MDALRVFPRLFLLATFWWTADTGYKLLDWYTHLAQPERGLEATGFAAIAWTAILGFLKLVYDRYAAGGRDWSQSAPAQTSTTTIATSTTETTP
jgi:hypothetical protein